MCRGNRSRHVSLNRSLSLPQGSSSAVVRAVRKEEEEMDKSVSEHDDEDGAVAAVANAAVAVAPSSSSSSRADSGYSQGSSQESLAPGIGGEGEQKPTMTSSEDEDVEGKGEKKGKKGSKRARTEEEEEECFKREEEFKMSRSQNGYASSSANTTDSAMVPGEGEVRLTRTIATSRPELLCNFCLSREKNAGIIHGGIIHQICCYPCAKRLYKRKQPCPMCRRRIEKISKIIVG